MNPAHAHLLLNHAPVIGTIVVLFILVVAYMRHSQELTRISFVLLAMIAVAGVAAYFTGEPAEELIEKLPDFSKSMVHDHEEMAEIATIALSVLGAASLAILGVFRRRELPRWAMGGGVIATLVVAGLMGYTALIGGKIRHTEIRAGTDAVSTTTGEQERER